MFDWARDYFDVMARDNDNPALWIVDDPTTVGIRRRRCTYQSNGDPE
jgi:hypothetical protein